MKNQQGVALFLVLWVLVLLTVIVGEFCFSMRTETNITRNFRDSEKAYYIARAGLNSSVLGLLASNAKTKKSSDDTNEPTVWRVNAPISDQQFGEGSFRVHIANGSGFVNINNANDNLLRLLFLGANISEEEINIIVNSIIDWRDQDNFHRTNGAENEYYQNLPEPYNCANRPFQSLDELLFVRGVTASILDSIRGMAVALNDDADTEKKRGRKRSRRERLRSLWGNAQQKINLNAAPLPLLQLLPNFDEAAVLAISEYRKEKDFQNLSEFRDRVGAEVYRSGVGLLNLDYSSLYIFDIWGKVEESKVVCKIRAFVDINFEKQTFEILEFNVNA